jgi:hypothetical protein
MFPEAIERAKFLDKWLLDYRKPLGPLHGLPVSVKVYLCTAILEAADFRLGWLQHKGSAIHSWLHSFPGISRATGKLSSH